MSLMTGVYVTGAIAMIGVGAMTAFVASLAGKTRDEKMRKKKRQDSCDCSETTR